MNQLDLTQPGGFPLRQDRLKFFQDSVVSTFGRFGRGPKVLLSFNNDTSQPIYGYAYVLDGCQIVDNGDDTLTIAAGSIYHDGEIFEVVEHTITKAASAYVVYHFAPDVVDDPAGVKEYFNGISHATQKVRTAKLGYTVFVDAGAQLAALVSYPITKVVVSTGTWKFSTWQDTIKPPTRDLTRLNGWSTSHNGYVRCGWNFNKVVEFDIALVPGIGSPPTSGQIASLPVGYRPAGDLKFDLAYYEAQNIYLLVKANGEVRVVDNANADSDLLVGRLVSASLRWTAV